MRFFDAHLDLACLALNGRDMGAEPGGQGPWAPACVTFPALARGRVEAFMGTIFTEADGSDRVAYPASDPEAAHRAGAAQLDLYHQWHAQGLIRLVPEPRPSDPRCVDAPVPRCLLLMECADPIRTPDELDWWVRRGVRAVGLAWARGSRYAGGNSTPDRGLTDLGRELLKRMAHLGVVHDLSHLSQRAVDDALDLGTHAPGMVIASHSNARSCLTGTEERQLADDTIRQIGRLAGVVGLNLCANFLKPGIARADRPSIDDALRHVDRIAELMGHDRGVGLGSDLDGGFSALHLPAGIDGPHDFHRLTDALSARGWSPEGVNAFAWGNWARFFNL
ncbi:MAG: hypothetical protein FJ255_10310 [Phycisphaerae bacterium]|nr:hypothetical protein [Phycisphaerae bacterium]